MKLPLLTIAKQLILTTMWICCLTSVHGFAQAKQAIPLHSQTIECGTPMKFTARFSPPIRGAATYEWQYAPGEQLIEKAITIIEGPTSELILERERLRVGTHLITVKASTKQGQRSDKWKITVQDTNKPVITALKKVNIEIKPNDSADQLRKTAGIEVEDLCDGILQKQAFNANPPGPYDPGKKTRVTLTATDTAGHQVQQELIVSVAEPPNRLPIATLEGPAVLNVTELATFSAKKSSDPEGSTLKYQWDFGDATTAAGPVVKHQYDKPGQYTVTLTATDNRGGRDKATWKIEAQPTPPPKTVEQPTDSLGDKPTPDDTLTTDQDRSLPAPTTDGQGLSLLVQLQQWLAQYPLGWVIAAALVVITLVGSFLLGPQSSRRKVPETNVPPTEPIFRFKAQTDPTGLQEITPLSGLTFDIEIYLRPTLDSGEPTIVEEGQLAQQGMSALPG